MRAALALGIAVPVLAACAPATMQAALPDAAPFIETSDADADGRLAASLEQARRDGTRVLAIFGANWCHDSRALAGWLQTPRFQALTQRAFQIVYIDAGIPQSGEGRHLDLAAAHGVADITGTPSVLVLDGAGRLLNSPGDAKGWRNAASRSEDAIFTALERYAALEAR